MPSTIGGILARIGVLCSSCALAVSLSVGAPVLAQDSANSEEASEAEAPIPFGEVLANPGDLELSFRYARQQIRRGDLTGAAATLERILLNSPDLNDVRLLYAIVLYRLDSVAEAEQELERVDPERLPADLRAEHERYVNLVERRQRMTRMGLTVSAGLAYESNANAAPSSGEALVVDIPLDVNDEEDDLSYLANGRFRVQHELETQTPAEAFAEITGSVREHVEVDAQDLRYGAVSAGATIHELWGDLTPAVHVGTLTLSNERFYSFIGPSIRLERRLGEQARAFVEVMWLAEDFDAIAESQTADERSGPRFQATSGLRGALGEGLTGSISVTGVNKSAKADFQAYHGGSLSSSVTKVVLGEQFVQGAVTVGFRDYDENDPFISARTRQDKYLRLRLSYGLPLPFGEQLAEELQDVMVVPSIEYYRQDSTIQNFDHKNVIGSLMVTKQFNF